MKIIRALVFSVVGVALPVALALGAYSVSARSFEVETPLVPVERIAEPQSPLPSPSPSPTPTPSATASPDDKSGRCSELEHRGDPECLAGGEDNSGPGGGNSGSDSDNSGPGGGSSGSGSDNSGPGGGDD